jgi:two-component system, sensor histidine kinase and response regulator
VEPETTARPARILVADDNVQILGLVEAILGSAGFEVVTCERGVRAVELAGLEPFDLILLDAMMPDLDGFDACEQIRARPDTAEVPIAFITGMTDASTFEDAVEVGADEVLSKPVSRGSLLIRVRSLLRLGRLRDERRQAHALIEEQRDQLVASRREQADLTELLLADLEGPLNAIRARSGELARDVSVPLDVQIAAQQIEEAERALQEVVRTLLDVHNSAEGVFVARPEWVTLDEIFSTLLVERGRQARQLQVVLAADLDAAFGATSLHLDGALLRRALGNLLDHSLAAARPGSVVTLRGRTDPSGELALGVHDDARLAMDEQNRLDGPAGPGESTLTGRLPRSRGLGLVLCRLVAHAHHGRVAIRSADDSGTEVSLHILPLPPAASDG